MKILYYTLLCFFIANCRPNSVGVDVPNTQLTPVDSIDISSIGMYSLSSLAASDSAFFMSSGPSKAIYSTDHLFNPIANYSRVGRGPMEITDASDIVVSDKHVYVIDFSQRKLIEFTTSLVPVSEFISQDPPFGILAIGGRKLWMSSFDFDKESIFALDFANKTQVHIGELVKTRYPMEGLAYHAKNYKGVVLRYRQFNNRLDLFRSGVSDITFSNPSQPERPELDPKYPEMPVFKTKIHHSAFLTADRACVLSGDHTPGNQPVQCFDFLGQLVARYSLKQDPSMISVYTDSTLYTYSPKTNHIYVYNLGF